jgi:capsule biosynthesis phosphatase
MRICIDIDGVLCELKNSQTNYADVKPISGAVKALCQLRQNGHFVILYTARHMKTTGGNLGAVLAKQASITLTWLEKHGFEYDEIYFGKPWADVYIDDLAIRFRNWQDILESLEKSND